MERPDFDLDGMVIVFPEEFNQRVASNTTCGVSYEYYWKMCRVENYMKICTASEMVYRIYRLSLQENEILFPCRSQLDFEKWWYILRLLVGEW